MSEKPNHTGDELPLIELEKKPLYRLYRFLHLDLKQTLTVNASAQACAEHLQRIESKYHHLALEMQQTNPFYQFDMVVATPNGQSRRHVIGAIMPSATSDMSLITLRTYPSAMLFFFGCFVLQLVILQALAMARMFASDGTLGGATLPLCVTFMVLFVWFMGYQEKRAALTVITNHLMLLNGEQTS